MLKQIKFELFKMSRRPRTYLGYVAFLFINIGVLLGLKYGHFDKLGMYALTREGWIVAGSAVNAELMMWIVVGSELAIPILTMFLPFFICLIFGEIVGGEVADGTLRTVLTRPVRRTSFFIAKFVACIIYALSMVLFLGISAYLIGLAFFGHGGLQAGNTRFFLGCSETEGLTRLAIAYGLVCVGAVTVGMIAFFISSWLNNSLGAIGAAIMLLFTCLIISEIPWFKPIWKYLFSTHLFVTQMAFMDPIPWHEITYSLKCLGTYIGVLFLISLLIFRRKDVLA